MVPLPAVTGELSMPAVVIAITPYLQTTERSSMSAMIIVIAPLSARSLI